MPLSKNPEAYPILCWNILRAFKQYPNLPSIDIDPSDEISTGEMSIPDQLRRARNLQLQFNGFRQSLRIAPHPDVEILEKLQFVIRMKPFEKGWIMKVERRSETSTNDAVSKALTRAGIDISELEAFNPRAKDYTSQGPQFRMPESRAPRRFETSFVEFDDLTGQGRSIDEDTDTILLPSKDQLARADQTVADVLGMPNAKSSEPTELPKTLAEFNKQRDQEESK